MADRFAALGHDRAHHTARDEVGTQLLYTLSGATADVALALSLVAAAPAAARGDLTVGDLGVIASFSAVVAGLPRFVGRLGAVQRQADVSANRLARLLPEGRRTLDGVAGDHELRLQRAPRHLPADAAVGPVPGTDDPDLPFRRPADERSRHPAQGDAPGPASRCAADGPPRDGAVRASSTVDLPSGPATVVVTGPVGSGKRAPAGDPRAHRRGEAGTIRWDGEVSTIPPHVLVPPRVAYVPQVPRLFSEPLADTVCSACRRAARGGPARCRLDEDVAAMPDGLGTVVGPRGVRLSGGQVQRAPPPGPWPAGRRCSWSTTSRGPRRRHRGRAVGRPAPRRRGPRLRPRGHHRPQVLARAADVVRLKAGRRV